MKTITNIHTVLHHNAKYHSRQAMLCCNHRIAVHEVPLETEHGVKPVVFGRTSCCFDIYIIYKYFIEILYNICMWMIYI